MSTVERFVVRQKIVTAKGNLMIVVHEGSHYREAEMFYDSALTMQENDYFEFCKIQTNETCLSFTKER